MVQDIQHKISKYTAKYTYATNPDDKRRYYDRLQKYISLSSVQTGGSDNKVNIIFVRHGESTQNKAMRSGDDYDINNIVLTDIGKVQASETGSFLNSNYTIDKVYSSPIHRCIETTTLITNGMDYDFDNVTVSELLIESGETNHDYFDANQEDQRKLVEQYGEDLAMQADVDNEKNMFEKLDKMKNFMERLTTIFNITPTIHEVANNYTIFMNDIVNTNDKCVLVVCHRGTIEMIEKLICGIDIDNQTKFSNVTNCSILCVQYDKSTEKFALVSKANNDHLTNNTQ